jgi:nucleoside-diphosphate-sugar epimerase
MAVWQTPIPAPMTAANGCSFHPSRDGAAITVDQQEGARVLIVRAGDFFGPKSGNNSWFSQGLVTPGKPVTAVSYPGRHGVGHQWAYLPDVARTMVELLERRESLESFATFHMAGHWDADGTQMVESIRRVVKHPFKLARGSRTMGCCAVVSPSEKSYRGTAVENSGEIA